jgi:hypothetical protein
VIRLNEINSNTLSNLIQDISEKMYNNKSKDINKEEEVCEEIEEKNDTSNSLSDIINIFTKNQDNSNNENSGLDMNTIFKIQKIISNINKDDPRKKLLLSLKPFLRKSRQDKINEYISYLTIVNALRNIW